MKTNKLIDRGITQDNYNKLADSGKLDSNTIYRIVYDKEHEYIMIYDNNK
jgi:hypothetical protein